MFCGIFLRIEYIYKEKKELKVYLYSNRWDSGSEEKMPLEKSCSSDAGATVDTSIHFQIHRSMDFLV